MANIRSAKKRARQTVRRTLVNKDRVSRMRTFIKKVEEAIRANDKDSAALALKNAEPEVSRGAAKGVIHRNTAARKISRLAKAINKL
ncbi:MAG: 30S ribosomal protein S20 [Alphaproteobacteria bacterium]|nr:MAG: 30S ribosomal protein S20 [Alphaproteobacteria bacterium]